MLTEHENASSTSRAGEILMAAPAVEGIDLCAVEAFCFLLRESVHWKDVCKATPYLEGKPKGDKSMAV